jgi:hypothetical protein
VTLRNPLALGLSVLAAWFGACQSSFDECRTRSECLGAEGGTSSIAGSDSVQADDAGRGGTAGASIGGSSSGAGEAGESDVGGGGASAGHPFDGGAPGEVGGETSAPAGPEPPASGSCQWDAPFGPARKMPAPFNSSSVFGMPTNDSFWLSDDGLSAYFSARSNDAGSDYDIFSAQRASSLSEFSLPQPLELSSSTVRERQLSLSADELRLAYQDGEGILLSVRASKLDDFEPGVALPAPVNLQIAQVTSGEPFLTRDGKQLYFTSNRLLGNDLYVVRLAGQTPIGEATPLAELNTSEYEGAPLLTTDALTIYYQSGVKARVWVAHRPDPSSPFENAHAVSELQTELEEWPEAVSADGCHIYTCRRRGYLYELYEAFRSPTATKP